MTWPWWGRLVGCYVDSANLSHVELMVVTDWPLPYHQSFF